MQDRFALFGIEGVERTASEGRWNAELGVRSHWRLQASERSSVSMRARRSHRRAVAIRYVDPTNPAGSLDRADLFDRDALGEIARLIDVAAAAHGDVVREQLQRQRPSRSASAARRVAAAR